MMRPAAPSVVRSAIAGRPARSCSASKRRATGLTSAAPTPASRRSSPAPPTASKIDAFGLFTGQIGYAWNNVLLYVKGGAAVTDNKYEGLYRRYGALFDRATETRWGGTVGVGLEYGFAPNWSAAIEYDHLFMQDQHQQLHQRVPGCRCRHPQRSHQAGRRSGHRPPELQVRRPGHREVLISRSAMRSKAPGIARGFFRWRARLRSSGGRKRVTARTPCHWLLPILGVRPKIPLRN